MFGFSERLYEMFEALGIATSLTPLQRGMVQSAIDDTTRPLRDRIDTLTALGIPTDKAAAALKGI